jgi:Tfp pilus assembly protein PilF
MNEARSLARIALSGDKSRGGLPAALDVARGGVNLDPNFPAANAVFAEVANASGDYENALAFAYRAILLYPGDASYDETALQASTKWSDASRSRYWLERMLERKESSTLRAALGQAYLRLGDGATARVNATRALELDPANTLAQQILRQAGS